MTEYFVTYWNSLGKDQVRCLTENESKEVVKDLRKKNRKLITLGHYDLVFTGYVMCSKGHVRSTGSYVSDSIKLVRRF